MYSLKVKSLSIGTKNLAILYVGVPVTEGIVRKGEKPSMIFLWTFARP